PAHAGPATVSSFLMVCNCVIDRAVLKAADVRGLAGLHHQRADPRAGFFDFDVKVSGLVGRELVGDGIPGLLGFELDVVAVQMDLLLLIHCHVHGDLIALMHIDRGRVHLGACNADVDGDRLAGAGAAAAKDHIAADGDEDKDHGCDDDKRSWPHPTSSPGSTRVIPGTLSKSSSSV